MFSKGEFVNYSDVDGGVVNAVVVYVSRKGCVTVDADVMDLGDGNFVALESARRTMWTRRGDEFSMSGIRRGAVCLRAGLGSSVRA